MSAAAGEFLLLALLSHHSVVALMGCNDKHNCTTELCCGENEKREQQQKWMKNMMEHSHSVTHQKATENSHKVTFSTTSATFGYEGIAKVMIRWKTHTLHLITDKEKTAFSV